MRWGVELIAAIALLPQVAWGANLSGYYKSFSVAFDSPHAGDPITGAVIHRLRLDFADSFRGHVSFDFAYDLALRIQDPSLFETPMEGVFLDALDYRIADLDASLYPYDRDSIGSVGLFHNLDRANITARLAFADLTVGRQAIAWGSARVINPTDVIAPFAYSELDTEDRTGIDAVRVRVPIGALGELDAGYVFGRDFAVDQSAFFGRSQFNAAETDLSPLIVRFREQWLFGMDVARGIGGAGAWLESAFVFTPARGTYFCASVGMDYSFGGETYGFIEYHFNGAGARNPEDDLANMTRSAHRDVYPMGTHYLAPGITHQLTPLIALRGQFLANLTDPSVFLAPGIEYNIEQDFYLSTGAFIGIGKRPKAEHFQSEFGGYPNILFFAFRIYY